jgi:hypothetical protein
MKTKLFFLALMATLSFSVSAGTFLKLESGSASWTVNVKDKKGTVQVYTNSQGYDGSGLESSEQQKVIFLPMSFGRSVDLPMKFELSDERSQETVEAFIVSLMKTELTGQPIKVLDSEVEFQNITCLETGIFKKQLQCSSPYKAKLSVEFSK